MKLKLPNNFIARIVAMVIISGLISAAFVKPIRIEAVFDPEKAITYKNFAAKVSVENSVLFIGTYIIHKDALTDDLYEKATASGSESGQDNIYYKSELADGKWFATGNIVNGIKGISTEGKPESIDTINPLYVTYYVGSDGILKDTKTMAAINPFDLPDPYDLSGLAELEPIRTQYTSSASAKEVSQEDFLKNKNSSDNGTLRSDVYTYQMLSTFFSLNLRDAQTDKLDRQLHNLNSNYLALKKAGQEEEAKMVYGLMDKVDATRRAIVMEKLSEVDENLLNALYELCSGSQYTVSGSFKDSSSRDITASDNKNVRKMQDSVRHNFITKGYLQSIFSNWFHMLGIGSSEDDWWTVLENEETEREEKAKEANEDNEDYVYDKTPKEHPFNVDSALLDSIGTAMSNCGESYSKHLAKALVDSEDLLGHVIYDYGVQVIDQASPTSLSGPVTNLKDATNIKDNIISDKDGELELLTNSLLTEGTSRFTTKAIAGTDPDYASYTSEGARKSILEEQKNKEEEARSQLQYLIEAMRQRETPPNALEYVNERIRVTEELLEQIPDDEFKTYSAASVNAHIVWLKEEAQKIIDSDESLKSKLTELKEKKEDLQKKRDQCLDDNDLSGAKVYDAKIAAVDKDIDDEGGDQKNLAEELVDKAIGKLADDSNADLSGVGETLAAIGAKDALDKLLDKAGESGASESALAGIQDAKDALDKQSGSGGQGEGESGDQGAGGSGKGNIDADELLKKLEEMLGESLDQMDEKELAIADAVMSELAQSGMTSAEEVITRITNKMLGGKNNKRNKYIYMQYKQNKNMEYISLAAISNITDYRYFYDDNKSMATMTYGMNIYIFTRGSDQVRKQSIKAESEKLSAKTVFQDYIYIAEEYADTFFKCRAEYIYGTEYAVCLTSKMQSEVAEYVEKLEELLAQ